MRRLLITIVALLAATPILADPAKDLDCDLYETGCESDDRLYHCKKNRVEGAKIKIRGNEATIQVRGTVEKASDVFVKSENEDWIVYSLGDDKKRIYSMEIDPIDGAGLLYRSKHVGLAIFRVECRRAENDSKSPS